MVKNKKDKKINIETDRPNNRDRAAADRRQTETKDSDGGRLSSTAPRDEGCLLALAHSDHPWSVLQGGTQRGTTRQSTS